MRIPVELGRKIRRLEAEVRRQIKEAKQRPARFDPATYSPFFLYDDEKGRRNYPGEAEAMCIIRYINATWDFPQERQWKQIFLKRFRVLRNYDRKSDDGGDRFPRSVSRVLSELEQIVRSGPLVTVDLRTQGLVVAPVNVEEQVALALLTISVKYGRIGRIRRCLHCGSWFYARFKHQQFCSDPSKRCQWNHYHTPEWRKKTASETGISEPIGSEIRGD